MQPSLLRDGIRIVPEINVVDISVVKPKAVVVGMVHPFAGPGGEGKTPGNFCAVGGEDREQNWFFQGALPVKVGGEKFPSDEYIDTLERIPGNKPDYFTWAFFLTAPSSLQ